MKYAIDSDMPKNRAGNRRNALKLGLAGIAVVGIGAAVTTAAWTDNVWFKAEASASSYNLQAALDNSGTPGTWSEAGSAAAAVVIPSTVFDELLPGDTVATDVWVRNNSSTKTVLVVGAPVKTGNLFDNASATAVADKTTLDAGETTKVKITVTTPTDWAQSYAGATGSLTVTVTGTATH